MQKTSAAPPLVLSKNQVNFQTKRSNNEVTINSGGPSKRRLLQDQKVRKNVTLTGSITKASERTSSVVSQELKLDSNIMNNVDGPKSRQNIHQSSILNTMTTPKMNSSQVRSTIST